MADDRCPNCEGELAQREWRGVARLHCAGCDYWWTSPALELAARHRRAPPPGARVSLVYEANGTDHSDVVLRAGDFVWRCDSYYFVLDHAIDQRPDPKRAMRLLLLQWKVLAASCREGETCFLPFDFSDQHSGWLRCEGHQTTVTLVPGWSAREGWAFYPSDCLALATSLSDFEPAEAAEPVEVARAALQADLDRSLELLGRGGPEDTSGSDGVVRREARWESFVDQVLWDTANAFQRAGVGVYVPVHTVESSHGVDLWALLGGDVCFVEVGSTERWDRAPGLYGRVHEHGGHHVYVFLVDRAEVDRAHVDAALDAIHALPGRDEPLGPDLARLA